MPTELITRWYLDMRDPARLAPAPAPDPDLEIRRAEVPSPELSRFLYAAVGGPWFWIDRREWSLERWRDRVEQPGVETWIAYLRGTPAGYAELSREGGDGRLDYFGLLPDFIGRGIGPRLLHAALTRLWALGPDRVTVDTCSLDGPAALRTYERAGFAVRETRRLNMALPDEPPGSW